MAFVLHPSSSLFCGAQTNSCNIHPPWNESWKWLSASGSPDLTLLIRDITTGLSLWEKEKKKEPTNYKVGLRESIFSGCSCHTLCFHEGVFSTFLASVKCSGFGSRTGSIMVLSQCFYWGFNSLDTLYYLLIGLGNCHHPSLGLASKYFYNLSLVLKMFLCMKEPYITKFKAFLYPGGFDLVWNDCEKEKALVKLEELRKFY